MALAEGRFPCFFAATAGPVLIWQESQASGESGTAWIRFARFEGGAWKTGEVSDSGLLLQLHRRPAHPLLRRAGPKRDDSGRHSGIGLEHRGHGCRATAAEASRPRGSLESSTTSVAPRIFPSASGGWLVFATQGRSGASRSAEPAEPRADAAATGRQPSSVSIYVAKSADGSSWSPFEPLVSDDEGLSDELRPLFLRAIGLEEDIVVFQTFILGEGDLSSHYALMSKTSADGGADLDAPPRPSRISPIPPGGTDAAPPNTTITREPSSLSSGGKLYVAWERRKTKSTQTAGLGRRASTSRAPSTPRAPAPSAAVGLGLLQALPARSIRRRPRPARARGQAQGKPRSSSPHEGRTLGERGRRPRGPERPNPARDSSPFARARSRKGQDLSSPGSRLGRHEPHLRDGPRPERRRRPRCPLNFARGKRIASESAQVRVDLPKDASGIKGYAYLWKKTPRQGERGRRWPRLPPACASCGKAA